MDDVKINGASWEELSHLGFLVAGGLLESCVWLGLGEFVVFQNDEQGMIAKTRHNLQGSPLGMEGGTCKI